MTEVIEGLKVYFDQALGTILLYKFERPQYENILSENPDADMSDVYGAEHLLRLFGMCQVALLHCTYSKVQVSLRYQCIGSFFGTNS